MPDNRSVYRPGDGDPYSNAAPEFDTNSPSDRYAGSNHDGNACANGYPDEETTDSKTTDSESTNDNAAYSSSATDRSANRVTV